MPAPDHAYAHHRCPSLGRAVQPCVSVAACGSETAVAGAAPPSPRSFDGSPTVEAT